MSTKKTTINKGKDGNPSDAAKAINEFLHKQQTKKVEFKKLSDKKKERQQNLSLDQVLKNLKKTLQHIAVMKTSSFVLNKMLNAAAKKNSFAVLVTQKISQWREYLVMLETGLNWIKLFAEHNSALKPFAQDQLAQILSITKNIRFILRATESLFTFSILTKFFSSNLISVASHALTVRGGILSIGLLYFMYNQFQSLYPFIEQYTTELWSFVKGVVADNIESLLEDLEENNPQLYQMVKEKLSELEKLQFLPVLLNMKVQEWKKAFKPYYYQYILPNLAVVIQKGYQAYYLSRKSIKNLDPAALLSQDPNWVSEFLQSLQTYFADLMKGQKPNKSKL